MSDVRPMALGDSHRYVGESSFSRKSNVSEPTECSMDLNGEAVYYMYIYIYTSEN